MNKTKLFITFMILFITIGIAAVATSMAIDGSTLLSGNLEDFQVYFSNIEDVSTNPNSEIEVITKQKFTFTNKILNIEDVKKISFDITNASSNYDAEVSLLCRGSNDYLSVSYDVPETIAARKTESGFIEIKMNKTYAGEVEFDNEITCTLDANATERTELDSSVIPPALKRNYEIGETVVIENEAFNVISQTEDTVTLFARYNIGHDYKQNSSNINLAFAEENGWEYETGKNNIDIQEYSTNPKTYINGYVDYLKTITKDDTITGDLIDLDQLIAVGCTLPADYIKPESSSDRKCSESPNASWLVNGQYWWTKSAVTGAASAVWRSNSSGTLNDYSYDYEFGVRPTITLLKDTVEKYDNYKMFELGKVIYIDGEAFNIIGQTKDTISLLAQHNIGVNNRQSTDLNYVAFSETDGWEDEPRPQEVDVQLWGSDVKTVLNNYATYIQGILGDYYISGDLITMRELKNLGCFIPDDYSYNAESSTRKCVESQFFDWLNNGTDWWTRSAISSENLWFMHDDGYLRGNPYNTTYGVRPVIKLKKDGAYNLAKTYEIGEEISIGNEKFNVIKDNGVSITMLAKYNVDNYDPHNQTTEPMWASFGEERGWEYGPEPHEIDVRQWSKHIGDLVNDYETYLESMYHIKTSTNLITLKDLKRLGCNVPEDYTWGEGGWNCSSSPYSDWLINDQYWWTRSADSNNPNNVWFVSEYGGLYFDPGHLSGVRPIVTIDKSEL